MLATIAEANSHELGERIDFAHILRADRERLISAALQASAGRAASDITLLHVLKDAGHHIALERLHAELQSMQVTGVLTVHGAGSIVLATLAAQAPLPRARDHLAIAHR